MALRLPTFTHLCVLALFVTVAASTIVVKAKVSHPVETAVEAARVAVETNANMPGATFP